MTGEARPAPPVPPLSTFMNFIRLILHLINWLVIALITLLAVYLIAPNFNIFGGYRSYVVQSGSMEPSIMTGDIIVISDRAMVYSINDVVTFTNRDGRVVTHRIAAVEEGSLRKYHTKGDANRSEDEDFITADQVIGKVVLVIPKLGYFVAYTKSPQGLLFLVLIPAAVYILDELIKIKNVKSRS